MRRALSVSRTPKIFPCKKATVLICYHTAQERILHAHKKKIEIYQLRATPRDALINFSGGGQFLIELTRAP
jgi:hypothetical protein